MGIINKNRPVGDLKQIITAMRVQAKSELGVEITYQKLWGLADEVLCEKVAEFIRGRLESFSISELSTLVKELSEKGGEALEQDEKDQVDLEEMIQKEAERQRLEQLPADFGVTDKELEARQKQKKKGKLK